MDPRFERWLERDPDPNTRRALRDLIDADERDALDAAFNGRLAFGTAGLRGVVGVGTARMNRLVIRETSAGLGQHLLSAVDDAAERGVVVAYDGRLDSAQFARDAAGAFAALGLRVFLFDRLVATPVCAFAVRHVGAAAGVIVTASHNPPEYNGYKVYWSNGAQITAPHDAAIADAIDAAAAAPLRWVDPEDDPRVESLGDAVIDAYLEAIASLSTHPQTPHRAQMTLAYTPMHGVGAAFVERALDAAGFSQVHTVAAQREPDGHFPTVRFPNPEEDGAMDAVIALARDTGAALALANDPDADRLAVAVPAANGDFVRLTGDQIGALLGADRIAVAPDDAPSVVATTIVSSTLLGRIARAAGVGYFETLTGFKWIAAGAELHRARGERFLFGYEEAIGYTIGDVVRDKDGVSALLIFAEMTAALHAQGLTIRDRLEQLYRAHGLHLTAQRSLALAPGTPGSSITDALRAHAPEAIAGRAILSRADLRSGTRRRADGQTEPVDLPRSDVLIYTLDGDARVIVRPSGTEPKVKCYYELRVSVPEGSPLAPVEAEGRRALDALIDAHQATLNAP